MMACNHFEKNQKKADDNLVLIRTDDEFQIQNQFHPDVFHKLEKRMKDLNVILLLLGMRNFVMKLNSEMLLLLIILISITYVEKSWRIFSWVG